MESLTIIANALKGIGWAALPILLLPLLLMISDKVHAVSRAIITLIDAVSFRMGEVVKWALPALVLTTAFGVFALSIFGIAWTKLFESAEYFHASVIMLGAAATLLAGEHVRVDVFHTHMSQRQKAWVELIGYYVFLLPVCLVIIWYSQSFVNFAWRIFEGSTEADGIRGRFMLKTLIPVFAITMIAQGLSISLRAVMVLRGLVRPERPPTVPAVFGTHPSEPGI